ncbi:MAG: hypothetical protein ACHQYQ_11815 [Bacteriovoracales bacterium]
MTKILITLTILFSSISYAALKCNEQSKSGYSVQISDDSRSVTVKKAGKIVEKMGCTKISQRQAGADMERPILSCKSASFDTGFTFVVKTGGYSGETKAVLSKVSYVGTKPIANYLCK